MGRPDLASRALKMLRGCERGTTVESAKPGSEQGSPRRGESPHERVGFADWRHSLCAAKRTGLFLPRGTQARGTGCSNLAYPSPPQFITIKKMQPHTRLHLWLGRPDLNRRMEESKSSALPLGDGPAKEKTAQHNHCAVFGGVPREIRTLGLQSHNLAR